MAQQENPRPQLDNQGNTVVEEGRLSPLLIWIFVTQNSSISHCQMRYINIIPFIQVWNSMIKSPEIANISHVTDTILMYRRKKNDIYSADTILII